MLIGDIYDSHDPQKGNADILATILSNVNTIEEFVAEIKQYAGCYAILFACEDEVIILHDARGLREIYYCTIENQIVCGSQPNLIAQFSSPPIKPSTDPDLLDFYNNHLWDSRWIGDETYFGGVKHLLPNHYLKMTTREVQRYWPSTPLTPLNLEEAVEKSCMFLQGIIKAIVHRHPAMMAVTAGSDSRTLLAASKSVQSKIYYFINNHDMDQNNPDLLIPTEICDGNGISFHVHDVPNDVDDNFRQIFLNNTFLANERLLASIYNVYYKNHSDKVLILGVGEIGRTFYGKEPKVLTGYRVAYKLGYAKCPYVLKKCDQYVPELLSVAKKFGVNVMALIYWEQRLGNWGAVRNSESNIAIEKVDPYNSHSLYETFLRVDEKYRFYGQTSCVFFREMIRYMWPELLKWPINPPITMREKISTFLPMIGLYEPLKELKFRLNYLMHIMKNRQ